LDPAMDLYELRRLAEKASIKDNQLTVEASMLLAYLDDYEELLDYQERTEDRLALLEAHVEDLQEELFEREVK
jgi:hypothetical protein